MCCFCYGILTASVDHWSLASQLGAEARLDELDVASISVVGKDVGECVISIAWIVSTWARNVPLAALTIWESVPAWRPISCSGVTKIEEISETVKYKLVISQTYGLVESMYFPSLLISMTGA